MNVSSASARLRRVVALVALIVGVLVVPAHALDIELDLSEPPDFDVQGRPSAGVVFDKNFDSPGTDSPPYGVSDFFKDHGDWDYVSRPTDYDYSLSGGYQRLVVPERYNPVPGTTVDLPGGARLDVANEKKPRGGDVGIHKTYRTGTGDVWLAEAWVRLENVNRIDPEDFKARLTFHKHHTISGKNIECNDAQYHDVLAALVKMQVVCEVEPNIDTIRVNVRAHAMNDGQDRAAASGTVAVDRFRLELVSRGL